MEEAKYYVPGISEFHIGFQCQVFHLTDSPIWTEHTWEFRDFEWALFAPENMSSFRVKFLDRADIESEGWKYDGDWQSYSYDGFTKENDGDLSHTLHFDKATSHLIIEKRTTKNEQLFSGTIRNISEFRRLTKQLNIK